jgi:hypothetical protein
MSQTAKTFSINTVYEKYVFTLTAFKTKKFVSYVLNSAYLGIGLEVY